MKGLTFYDLFQCVLPLAKLSAMITMHKPGEQCVQAFSLKLSQVGADPAPTGAESYMKVCPKSCCCLLLFQLSQCSFSRARSQLKF